MHGGLPCCSYGLPCFGSGLAFFPTEVISCPGHERNNVPTTYIYRDDGESPISYVSNLRGQLSYN